MHLIGLDVIYQTMLIIFKTTFQIIRCQMMLVYPL